MFDTPTFAHNANRNPFLTAALMRTAHLFMWNLHFLCDDNSLEKWKIHKALSVQAIRKRFSLKLQFNIYFAEDQTDFFQSMERCEEIENHWHCS